MKIRKIILPFALLSLSLTACGDGAGKVNKDEWEAAFKDEAFANVKIVIKDSEVLTSSIREHYVIDNSKVYRKMVDTSGSEEQIESEFYYSLGDTNYVYSKEGDSWKKSETLENPLTVLFSTLRAEFGTYNDSNYDAGAYHWDSGSWEYNTSFENKKVVSAFRRWTGSQLEQTAKKKYYNVQFNDYGKQSVTLPE